MPELPEVETVLRGLAPHLKGQKITHVEVRRPDLRITLPKNFASELKNATFKNLLRRGKYLLLGLDNQKILMAHLGMSGQMGIQQKNIAPRKHDHVIITLKNEKKLFFHDPRRFGFLKLLGKNWAQQSPFSKMGPEPLDRNFTGQFLHQNLKSRRAPIKTVLMDQGVVAGLGNIYVCEALYEAGINPRRPANDLSAAQAARLAKAIRKVLRAALKSGGSSLRDFRHADGQNGYFQHSFAVYSRASENCQRCKKASVQRIVQAGRSTFFCLRCQS